MQLASDSKLEGFGWRESGLTQILWANSVENVVHINPVSKTVKGGRTRSFVALVVVGDRNGHVGAATGKAKEVADAIRKGVEKAKKNMISVRWRHHDPARSERALRGSPCAVAPAAPGTGVIAGGPVRAVLEAAGVRDVLSKSLGSNNPVNMVKATLAGLKALRTAEEVAALRGKSVEEIL